jgi:hypothetical protein
VRFHLDTVFVIPQGAVQLRVQPAANDTAQRPVRLGIGPSPTLLENWALESANRRRLASVLAVETVSVEQLTEALARGVRQHWGISPQRAEQRRETHC